jgi:MYXO-CTERM domain-containing protein
MKAFVRIAGCAFVAAELVYLLSGLFLADVYVETILGYIIYAFLGGALVGGVWSWRRRRS